MLPPDYRLRLMQAQDIDPIIEICKRVYPSDAPYTPQELAAHHRVFSQGQFVAEHVPTQAVAGSRLPGYAKHKDKWDPQRYVEAVVRGELVDPVLTVHLKDGWTVVRPIHGYLPHDDESAGWAAVIQWVNPECPPPPEFQLSK